MLELTELLKVIQSQPFDYIAFSPPLQSVCEDVSKYTVTQLPARIEAKKIGTHTVPANGTITTLVDSDNLYYGNEEFKERFPELGTRGASVIAEIAREAVYDPVEAVVRVTIDRYLIHTEAQMEDVKS